MVSTIKKGLTNVLLIDVTDMLHSPTVKLNLQRKQTMQEKGLSYLTSVAWNNLPEDLQCFQ